MTDLPPLPDCAIVLCKPDFGLPTPELFARLDGADLGPRPDTAAMAAALARGDLAAAAAGADGLIVEVHNDPPHALCDGAQSITPEQFGTLMDKLGALGACIGRTV